MSHTIIRIDSAPIRMNVSSAPVRLGLSAAQGPAGPAGPVGPNVVNASTTSDGTASLSVSNLTTVTGSVSGLFTAPTAVTLTSTPQVATTAFVQQELAAGTAVAKNLEFLARNQSGITIPKGSIVYISDATGNKPLITLAQANNDSNSAQTIGFVKTDIAHNGTGYVIVRGEIENLDTFDLTEGDQLYLSPTIAGDWTTTKPVAPQHLVYVGICLRAHVNLGIILVAIQNGYELNELHDVLITTPVAKQVVKRNAGNTLWVNEAIVSADVSDAASAATPNTLVLRTAGGAASFTGITNNGLVTFSTGTTFSYASGAIAALHRAALQLGSLATQNGSFAGSFNGTFSGTHSGTSTGTNTGDQDLTNFLNRVSQISVNGTSPMFNGPLDAELASTVGRRKWSNGAGEYLEFDGSNWLLHGTDGMSDYDAYVVDQTQEPWKINPLDWILVNGTDQPYLSIEPSVLIPLDVPAATIAVTTNQDGRVSPADMIGFGSGVFNGLISDINNDGGFLTAGTGGTLPITRGGTGATTAVLARTSLGSQATGDALFTAASPAAARTTLGQITATSTAQINAVAYTIGGAPVTGLQSIQLEADTLYELSWYGKFTSNGGSGYLWLNFSSAYDDLGSSAFQQFGRFHTTAASPFLQSTTVIGAAYANLGTQTNRTAYGSIRFKTVLATQVSLGWSQWNSGTIAGTSSLLTAFRVGIRPV